MIDVIKTSIMSKDWSTFPLFMMSILLMMMVWHLGRRLEYLRGQVEQSAKFIFGIRRRGIYVIHCVPTGAAYVGSTKTNFMARWGQHIRDLDCGKHSNARLQADWDEYGRDCFVFIVYEILDDSNAIADRENEILDWRAANIAPALNYNVARTKVYVQPAAPDVETVMVVERPKRRRRNTYTPAQIPPYDPSKPFTLEDLGLSPEEIEGLESSGKE